MSKYIYLDFEYTDSSEHMVNTVCVAWNTDVAIKEGEAPDTMWLYKTPKDKKQIAGLFQHYNELGYTFVSFAVTAEARAFIDIGLDPTKFKWIDLYVEWRQLRNCNDKYSYGTYFYKGMKMHSVAPNYKHPSANEGRNNTPVGSGLADCVARLLKVDVDKDMKYTMRNLILSRPEQFTEEEQKDIMEYCEGDIKYLPQIHQKMNEALTGLIKFPDGMTLEKAQLLRGEFAADVAVMESEGIPIDREAITNLRNNVDMAKNKLITNLVETQYPFFERKKKKTELLGTWVDKCSAFDAFIKSCPLVKYEDWQRTDNGRLSTDDDYLKKFEGIPEIKAYRETRKTLGQLKWLRVPDEGEMDLFDSIGSDDRMRSFFGIYGTQTARNAPQARKFIFAMSAWLRCLIRAPKGYVITELDYSSQEFAIAAILSNDLSMIEAYKSGDPYLYFAKQAHAVPENGTKAEYKAERDLFKATVLGLQFGMGVRSLAIKLTSDIGKIITEKKAQRLIDLHKRVFPVYWRWLSRIDREYVRRNCLVLPCGWALLGDNPQVLSVRNFPVQGAGSSVIRNAVRQTSDVGVKVIATLHDSLYLLSKEENVEMDTKVAKDIMGESFNKILGDTIKIRIDTHHHPADQVWVSEKGQNQYEILKEYLLPQENKNSLTSELLSTIFS